MVAILAVNNVTELCGTKYKKFGVPIKILALKILSYSAVLLQSMKILSMKLQNSSFHLENFKF